MQIRNLLIFAFFALPLSAQTTMPAPKVTTGGPVIAGTAGKRVFVYHNDMGKWWQNADIVKKLQITDAQAGQLDQIFLDHRMRLIDYGADMEKQDLKLQTLLDDDVPNEAQINTQVDQVLDARGKLEREYTTMNLDLRKVLSLAQWRQLKSIRGGTGDRFFVRKALPPLPPAPPTPGVMPLAPMDTPIVPPSPEPFD
ncbi:MAG TPA: periplasmic heavy metal sensor [Terriglobales bacterium]|nr:periplasmic heavy metal sensor [Terriglobales bacterium]